MARAGAAAALLAALWLPGAAAAQVAGDAPVAAPTPLPTPPAPVIALPTPGASSTPAASPTPRATTRATPTPRPSASATPAPARTPVAPASALPTAVPLASPSPAPAPSLAPQPITVPSAVPSAAPAAPIGEEVDHYWFAALGAVVLAAGALAWVVLRRRRADPIEIEAAAEQGRLDELAEPASATPVPDSAPAAPSFLDRHGTPARAHLTLAFRPVRAGLNLLSTTSENLVTIANDGDASAEDIRLQLRLVTAHAGLDAELAEIAADQIVRPVVPAFTLAPGERREVSAVGALPREAVQSLTAAGRPMFVPVVALAVAWRSGSEQRTLRQAFAIGVERVDSAKLAPFWLDGPAKSYDQVAARPHGPVREG